MNPTAKSLSPIISQLAISTIFFVVLVTGTTSGAWAASFMGLGDLPGGIFQSTAEGVSADGSTIVGAGMTDSGFETFRWTSSSGMVALGALPGSGTSEALAISGDGSIIVGWVNLPLPSGNFLTEAFICGSPPLACVVSKMC